MARGGWHGEWFDESGGLEESDISGLNTVLET